MMYPSPPEASGLSGLMLFAQQSEKLSTMRWLLFLLLVPFRVGSQVGGQSSQTLVHRVHMASHLFPLQLSSPGGMCKYH